MSRIGKRPIVLPAGVSVTQDERGVVTVKGPKGTLQKALHPSIKVVQEDNIVRVERPSEEETGTNRNENFRALHGLSRTLVANMVEGVTKGFEKQLEIQGVGFRAAMQGKVLQLNVGYSHAIEVLPREGIDFNVTTDPQTRNPVIVVSGIDKERVGQTAAEIRSLRKPEPYKGKGIRYKGEVIRLKQGKSGKRGAKGKK
ncbi:LSU ribosomal protein L6P [Chthonomonas calidirosea]|uniref:Large ribosomal subunit protein uL6 n=1 Tax=Chthonomonas calidirosea (strain DSM 23976 / ICMP 18418 / T49) TaxID=1303518 RepID=S0F081_CHTCT|nr:50S ribosomal protein L6 [Chthonomonas calidirosea]CCW36663.1 LSU ribosomal protein L6P [Chthonomonas calidirosea T49]CEK16661.1 LSU ribosomal protein L6P [Chthonomonas calidirosea]